MMPGWLVLVAVGLVVLAGVYALRTPPRVVAPSHLPGYDELHADPRFKAQKARLIAERGNGHCERFLCRRRDHLEQHLLVNDCLYEHRMPFDHEVRELCKPCHNKADRKRRAWERTRRGRRHYANLARRARAVV